MKDSDKGDGLDVYGTQYIATAHSRVLQGEKLANELSCHFSAQRVTTATLHSWWGLGMDIGRIMQAPGTFEYLHARGNVILNNKYKTLCWAERDCKRKENFVLSTY